MDEVCPREEGQRSAVACTNTPLKQQQRKLDVNKQLFHLTFFARNGCRTLSIMSQVGYTPSDAPPDGEVTSGKF